MERRGWLLAAILMCLLVLRSGRELKIKHIPIYNSTLGKTLAEYTSAVYSADLTQLFTWTYERCDDLTEAYVGFASDMNAVVLVFRGTQENSIQNWIEDLFWKQLDLDYPGMPEAKVHSGFYFAYHNTTLRDGVIDGIQKTREVYGNIPIMVTGHSIGGAMALFCALDLVILFKYPPGKSVEIRESDLPSFCFPEGVQENMSQALGICLHLLESSRSSDSVRNLAY